MNKIITPSNESHVFKTPYSNSLRDTLKQLRQNSAIGFTQSPYNQDAINLSQEIAQQLSKQFDQFLVIGIGGSSMGARALAEVAMKSHIHFLDNVDSAEFNRIWQALSQNPRYSSPQQALSKTGFLIVSKSGSTIEILWNYSLVENLMKDLKLNLIEQSYFVTENTGSQIAELARENKRPILEVPLSVGGRFSVLTPVGLVVAALCGLNLNHMAEGAKQALEDENEVLSSCRMFLESFKKNQSITLFWFYNSNFRWFGAWLQQLWAESLGKMKDNDGKPAPDFSTPMTAIGACDQHSILQQVAHGVKNKFVCFYTFQSVEKSVHLLKDVSFSTLTKAKGRNYGSLIASQAQATQEALVQNGVSTQLFNIQDENAAKTLGYLFMYFQLIVAVVGLHENINPFDQPGVALGKDLTIKKMNL